uniref:Homeobox domain-containing protein n=1 Tax=Gasterosteus aculeatus aculeatus TaxID=481459 RepID=A0AAQ4PS13_GASAC
MSSRRKSSTPCMVRVVSEPPEEQDDPEGPMDVEVLNLKPSEQEEQKQPRGYECKYCPFSTQHLNDFKVHVDSSHPNVILNPMYLCAACNFNAKKFDSLTEHNESQHPGETNFKFKRIKRNNQTILEQTIESGNKSVECEVSSKVGEGNAGYAFPACISPAVTTQNGRRDDLIQVQKDQITAVNINGTVIIPEPTVLKGVSHVAPMLKRPPNFNSVPKIAVPLNTTKYNPSLDDNSTLITSFNKFPYPTHAELSWLTAASKHPEDQIKVWFTTQRLKQGITWSPEEVEEARKKMFNGSIPPAHHTFTTLPATTFSQPSAKSSQQTFVHTTVGHVQTAMSSGLSAVAGTNPPAGVAVTANHELPNSSPPVAPEIRRPTIIQSIRAPAKPPTQISGYLLDSRKEQQGGEGKACYPRGDKVLTPLAEANGTSRTDGKWPHDQTPLAHNNGVQHFDGLLAALKPDFHQKSSVLTQFPLLERMKGKTAEQLKVLEENFLSNSFPTLSDVDNLAGTTRLSHQEIDSWFVERRALRDNLEQALLNSMGTKEDGAGVGHLKSPLLPCSAPPINTPPVPSLNACSVPPDGRSLALLVGDFAQTRWPSPEEFSQLDGRTGRAELARWFNDGRLQSGGPELSELFHNNGVNGGQGPKSASIGVLQRCQEGPLANNSSSRKVGSSGDLWPNNAAITRKPISATALSNETTLQRCSSESFLLLGSKCSETLLKDLISSYEGKSSCCFDNQFISNK